MAKKVIPKMDGWVRTCEGCKKKEMGWFEWGGGRFRGCLEVEVRGGWTLSRAGGKEKEGKVLG